MSTVLSESIDHYDRLRSAKGFVFDMDGVIYLGSHLLPGVNDLFDALRLFDIPFVLGTNNSTATPQNFVERMAALGVKVEASQIQTSTTVTRELLVDDPTLASDATILCVGQPSIASILQTGTSFRILPEDGDPATADAVVAGLDFDFTYQKMARAVAAIGHGARFIATNADDRLPTEDGYQPGAGACIAGITVASRRQPLIVGKPEPLMMTKAAEWIGADPGDVVMVGDRLDTDILSAQRAGMMTALVLTGLTDRAMVAQSEILPDFVFEDLPTLLQAFTRHG
ncbi:MAG: HAD-IIA family hydrolase [Thermomicrobiales bacterium]|nr:HAD-IIA family hydrolase [Thermomicrobiales bacterium]MCO5228604.1 HAD-IIA family hydrolase [Thermomicrobiales bacterium]